MAVVFILYFGIWKIHFHGDMGHVFSRTEQMVWLICIKLYKVYVNGTWFWFSYILLNLPTFSSPSGMAYQHWCTWRSSQYYLGQCRRSVVGTSWSDQAYISLQFADIDLRGHTPVTCTHCAWCTLFSVICEWKWQLLLIGLWFMLMLMYCIHSRFCWVSWAWAYFPIISWFITVISVKSVVKLILILSSLYNSLDFSTSGLVQPIYLNQYFQYVQVRVFSHVTFSLATLAAAMIADK